MPTAKTGGGACSGMPAVETIEDKLVSLRLTASEEQSRKLDAILGVLRDIVSVPLVCGEDQDEPLWWEAFAEVYANEVVAQTRAAGGREPSASCKRQILADILVWAEVTQEHYDSGTLRFVTDPHKEDESFQRIGRAFRAIKASKGLGAGGVAAGGNAGARGGSAHGSESAGSDRSEDTSQA